MLEGENRSRLGVTALVVTCVVLTAVVTRNLVGGGGGSAAQEAASADQMKSMAETRDARNTPGMAAPMPVRAVGSAGKR
jgi:hypothetical protein